MKLNSGLYVGDIQHRRFSPRENIFSYNVCYFFLDLNEIVSIFRIPFLFSYDKPGILSFWRKDYLGQSSESLDTSVRNLIALKTQQTCTGPIRLLANISYFGFCFNPVCFYYCYADDGVTLQFIVSEITNTPWGEKHQQVFTILDKKINTYHFPKDFHVSPFMPMEIDYTWHFKYPSEQLFVYMQDSLQGSNEIIFDSTLRLDYRPLTAANVIGSFFKFPFITFKTMAAIYYQAMKLFIKRIPFYSHPSKEKVYDNSNIT
jgi:DUF1365 family protein